jgi:outer membrane protein
MSRHRREKLTLWLVLGLPVIVHAQDLPGGASTGREIRRLSQPFLPRQSAGSNDPVSVWHPQVQAPGRIHELLKAGKLELTVADAIALALENSPAVAAASYGPPIARTDFMRAKAGSTTRGVPGAFLSPSISPSALGGVAGGGSSFDPTANVNFGWNQSTVPLNITVLQGVPVVTTHDTTYSCSLSQAFTTGTTLGISLSGTRQSTTGVTSLFNPQLGTQLQIYFTQPFLNGFGRGVNARFIRVARNEMRFSESAFRQDVMATVAQVSRLYWEVAAAHEQERIAEKALELAGKMLDDTTKEARLGVIAPLEVIRARAEVFRDRGALARARESYEETAEQLKTAISKQVDSDLAGAEIIPITQLPPPSAGDQPSLDEALRQATENRPEIRQANLNLDNQEIVTKAAHNALLPSLNLFGSYAPQGLSGDFLVRDASGNLVGMAGSGVGDSLSQTLRNEYPSYSVGVSLSIPLRNRTAHADLERALFERRQLKARLQQQINTVEEDVRRAYVALSEAKEEIDAAEASVGTAEEALEGEEKKFQLGVSDVFRVVLAQRDFFTAEESEVSARADYADALIRMDRATGNILAKNHVHIDAGPARGGTKSH